MAYNWVNSITVGQWGAITSSNNCVDVYPGYTKSPGAEDVMTPWGTAVLVEDSAAEPIDSLYCHGGGHTDGWLNGWYRYKLENDTPSWELLAGSQSSETDTVFNDADGVWADNRPSSTHGYGNSIYLPVQQTLLRFGRPGWWSTNADGSRDLDGFNLSTGSWEITGGVSDRTAYPNVNDFINGWTCRNNANTKIAFFGVNADDLVVYDIVADTHVQKKTDVSLLSDTSMSMCYDTLRDRVVFCGANNGGDTLATIEGVFDLDLPSPWQAQTSSGNAAAITMQAQGGLGFIYIPEIDRYVMWDGGQELYELNPETWVWTALPVGGATPTASQTTGTFGRMQWSKNSGCIIVVNNDNESVYAYRLDQSAFATPKVASAIFEFQSEAAIGGNGWNDPTRLLTSGFNDLGSSPANGSSAHRLFNSTLVDIPTDATDIAIQVYYQAFNDSVGGDDGTPAMQVSTDGTPANFVPTTPVEGVTTQGLLKLTSSMGGTDFTGGRTWTPSEVNHSDFSVIVKVGTHAFPTEIDGRKVFAKIYYKEAASTVHEVSFSQASDLGKSSISDMTAEGALNKNIQAGGSNSVIATLEPSYNQNKDLAMNNSVIATLDSSHSQQIDLSESIDGDVSLESSYSQQASFVFANNSDAILGPSVSMAVSLALSSISDALIESDINIGCIIGESSSSGVTFEVSNSFDGIFGDSVIQNITYEKSIGIGSLFDVSYSNGVNFESNFNQGITLSDSYIIDAIIEGTVTISVDASHAFLGELQGIDVSFLDGVSLFNSESSDYITEVNNSENVSLSSVEISEVSFETALGLPGSFGVNVSGGKVIESALSFAINNSITQVVDISINGAVALATSLLDSEDLQVVFSPSINIANSLLLSTVSNTINELNISIGNVSAIVCNGNIIAFKILVNENRTIIVNAKSRHISIVKTDNTIIV